MPYCAHACYLSPFCFFSSLFDLNFLISSLIYVTLLGFVLNPSPGSSRDVPHRFCFCSSVFILFFSFLPFLIFLNLISAGTVFSEDFFSHKLFPMFFFFLIFCSLSGVHSVFTIDWWRRASQPQKDADTHRLVDTHLHFFLDLSQLSISSVSDLYFSKDRSGWKPCLRPSHSCELSQVLTRCFLAVQTIARSFSEPDRYFPLQTPHPQSFLTFAAKPSHALTSLIALFTPSPKTLA